MPDLHQREGLTVAIYRKTKRFERQSGATA